MHSIPTDSILNDIITRATDGEFLCAKNFSHGWSGSSVYLVDVAGSQFGTQLIVKIGSPDGEPDFADEPESSRVYGVRFSNLECVYQLMVENNIKIPKLHATGTTCGRPYAVMEFLQGITTVSDEVVGAEMGRINRVTRSYQGWTSMKQPYSKSWKETFFSVMRSQLEESVRASAAIKAMAPKIVAFLKYMESNWLDPAQFVLSHLDGFQGMAIQSNGVDILFSGVIDLEDHGFADQRFVLAGHELINEFWRARRVSDTFWISYQEQAAIEDTYSSHKTLFQLFYLLNWLLAFTDRIHDKSAKGTVRRIEKLIKGYLENKNYMPKY